MMQIKIIAQLNSYLYNYALMFGMWGRLKQELHQDPVTNNTFIKKEPRHYKYLFKE